MAVLTCKCGSKLKLTDEQIEKFYGKRIKCKRCGRVATVPKSLGDVIEEAITLPPIEAVPYSKVPVDNSEIAETLITVTGCLWMVVVPFLSGISAWKITEPHYSGFLFCVVFIGV